MVRELHAHFEHHRGGDCPDGCGCRLRVLALSVQVPSRRVDVASDHSDVPAAAGLRRDLLAVVQHLRGVSVLGPELTDGSGRGLPGWRARGQHVPDVRLLQHDSS